MQMLLITVRHPLFMPYAQAMYFLTAMSAKVKRRRLLSELAGLKFISHSALLAILHKLEDSYDLLRDSGISRRTIACAMGAHMSLVTVHGKVLQEVAVPLGDGTTFAWVCVHPAALLSWMCVCPRRYSIQNYLSYVHAVPSE